DFMKKLLIAIMLGGALLVSATYLRAQNKTAAARYEYAIAKWDGLDRVSYYLPDRADITFLKKEGVNFPKGVEEEEFSLAYAAKAVTARTPSPQSKTLARGRRPLEFPPGFGVRRRDGGAVAALHQSGSRFLESIDCSVPWRSQSGDCADSVTASPRRRRNCTS